MGRVPVPVAGMVAAFMAIDMVVPRHRQEMLAPHQPHALEESRAPEPIRVSQVLNYYSSLTQSRFITLQGDPGDPLYQPWIDRFTLPQG